MRREGPLDSAADAATFHADKAWRLAKVTCSQPQDVQPATSALQQYSSYRDGGRHVGSLSQHHAHERVMKLDARRKDAALVVGTSATSSPRCLRWIAYEIRRVRRRDPRLRRGWWRDGAIPQRCADQTRRSHSFSSITAKGSSRTRSAVTDNLMARYPRNAIIVLETSPQFAPACSRRLIAS